MTHSTFTSEFTRVLKANNDSIKGFDHLSDTNIKLICDVAKGNDMDAKATIKELEDYYGYTLSGNVVVAIKSNFDSSDPDTFQAQREKRLDEINSSRLNEFLLHEEAFGMLQISVWNLDERKESILDSDVIDANDCIQTEINFLLAVGASDNIKAVKIRFERLADLATFLSTKTKTENDYYVISEIKHIVSSIKDLQNRLSKMLLKKSDVKFVEKRV